MGWLNLFANPLDQKAVVRRIVSFVCQLRLTFPSLWNLADEDKESTVELLRLKAVCAVLYYSAFAFVPRKETRSALSQPPAGVVAALYFHRLPSKPERLVSS